MVKLYIKVLWPGVDPADSCYNEVRFKRAAEVKQYYEDLRKCGYSPTLTDEGKDEKGVQVFRLRYSPADWAKMVISEMDREQGAHNG